MLFLSLSLPHSISTSALSFKYVTYTSWGLCCLKRFIFPTVTQRDRDRESKEREGEIETPQRDMRETLQSRRLILYRIYLCVCVCVSSMLLTLLRMQIYEFPHFPSLPLSIYGGNMTQVKWGLKLAGWRRRTTNWENDLIM